MSMSAAERYERRIQAALAVAPPLPVDLAARVAALIRTSGGPRDPSASRTAHVAAAARPENQDRRFCRQDRSGHHAGWSRSSASAGAVMTGPATEDDAMVPDTMRPPTRS